MSTFFSILHLIMQQKTTNFNHSKQSKQNLPDCQMYDPFTRDSLFACRKQNDIFLQNLKKGTLFRLGHHHKAQTQLPPKDPFLNWLQENNSQHSQDSVLRRKTMGEAYFYLNVQEIHKQKKLPKTILPSIQKLNSNHAYAKSSLSSSTTQNRSFRLSTQSPKAGCLTSEQTKGINTKELKPMIKPLHKKPCLNLSKTHKVNCYEAKLNKTQLFSNELNSSFYEKREIMIRSQFYLNDHKKKHGFNTFYQKSHVNKQPDADLSRIDGLKTKFVKGFEENLRKIEKEASVSCYNEVSSYLSRMKSQVLAVVGQAESGCRKRVRHGEEAQILNSEEEKTRTTLSRLKTQYYGKFPCEPSPNQDYLPGFLLKSLVFPPKRRHKISSEVIVQLAGDDCIVE